VGFYEYFTEHFNVLNFVQYGMCDVIKPAICTYTGYKLQCFHKIMVEFYVSSEEILIIKKNKLLYFTRKTQSHMGCMTFNRPQYGHRLSP
jgi:hypothetical protein